MTLKLHSVEMTKITNILDKRVETCGWVCHDLLCFCFIPLGWGKVL